MITVLFVTNRLLEDTHATVICLIDRHFETNKCLCRDQLYGKDEVSEFSLAAAFLCTDVASAPDRKEDKH